MKDGRFEVGDKVIGNEKTVGKYSITVFGWVGKVVSVKSDYALDSDEKETIEVSGPGGSWWVNHKCFDLYKGVTIRGIDIPECCGVCFAYDECGCKFVNIDKQTDIWKARAKNCPMKEE